MEKIDTDYPYIRAPDIRLLVLTPNNLVLFNKDIQPKQFVYYAKTSKITKLQDYLEIQ